MPLDGHTGAVEVPVLPTIDAGGRGGWDPIRSFADERSAIHSVQVAVAPASDLMRSLIGTHTSIFNHLPD